MMHINNSTPPSRADAAPKGLMTEYDNLVSIYPRLVIGFILAILGFVTNSVCLRVFLSMKSKDAVSVSFLGLASSDFTLCVISLGYYASTVPRLIEKLYGPQYRIDGYMLVVFYQNASICVSEVTILITLYIAIARCMCIAMPLQFKYSKVFTYSQTRGFIVGAWLFSVGVYIPIFANMGSKEVFSPSLNTTRSVLWVSAHRARVKDIVFMVTQVIVPFTTQVILIVCLLVMAQKLVQTRAFRHESTLTNTHRNGEGDPYSPNDNRLEQQNETCEKEIENKEPDTDNRSSQTSAKLSGKELQAVTQVAIISAVFVSCNFPMIIVSITSMLVPGFNITASNRYRYTYGTIHGFKRLSEQLNSSVNLFVYYKYNSKFREHCDIILQSLRCTGE